jgi:glutamate formiminotransferase/formiminotetrahydrofolate cyclodeaminase
MDELLRLVDEDTDAFNAIMDAFAMPKKTDEEIQARHDAIQAATLFAAQVPLRTMKASLQTFDICKAMAEEGNPASVSDAGVGALAARAAVHGAGLNVRINAAGLDDKACAQSLIDEAKQLAAEADKHEQEILKIVEEKL